MPSPLAPFNLVDTRNASATDLREAQQALFGLLIERERAFGFHPDVVTEYPDPLDALLADPVAYLAGRLHAAEQKRGAPLARVVVLTTYVDKLGTLQCAAGYSEEVIDMPAGPEHTSGFARTLDPDGVGTLYLEAVNEMDDKISPTFVLTASDGEGRLLAGMSGSVWTAAGECSAYVSTVVAREDAPAGTGSRLAAAVWDYLLGEGVSRVNLGTQTADGFYLRQGFRVIHTLVPRLRWRRAANGRTVWHDLVIMRKDL
ncbi:GNAT family N-acetyltransferase [Crenobacter intestini]|uniref:GNAT family N-acetyltransferase n=1 Tax=Crenobacter intestini TaxID=2563443 RepID=A0A4T0V6Q4_9NEIS|nr:GNAT family N-acetyltransferase [Crenobacter intestini]TIC87151.1 GNAT family N-acetyltransferase [Crenobacter intestini]